MNTTTTTTTLAADLGTADPSRIRPMPFLVDLAEMHHAFGYPSENYAANFTAAELNALTLDPAVGGASFIGEVLGAIEMQKGRS